MKCERSRNRAQHRYKMIHPLWSFNTSFLSCQNFEGNMLPHCYYVTCNNWCVSVAQNQHFYTLRSSSKGIHLMTRCDICILLCKQLICDVYLCTHDWKSIRIMIFWDMMPCSLTDMCYSTQYHNPEDVNLIFIAVTTASCMGQEEPIPLFHYSNHWNYQSKYRL